MKVDIKNKEQIARMRVACRMSAEIRDICANALVPGMRTREVNDLVRDYCLRHKVKASFYGCRGFPAFICVSVNDEVIHGVPGNRMIMPGDLVKTDVGICTQGYNGDTSRTVIVGGVATPDAQRLVDTTKRCLKAAIATCGPGVHLGDVGYAIQSTAEAEGFSVVRDWIGHGVGRTVHEDPDVPNYGKPGTKLILRPGMTIAIEPMIAMTKAGADTYIDARNGWSVITKDHSLAAHFEHTVLITDDGCEILTVPADYP